MIRNSVCGRGGHQTRRHWPICAKCIPIKYKAKKESCKRESRWNNTACCTSKLSPRALIKQSETKSTQAYKSTEYLAAALDGHLAKQRGLAFSFVATPMMPPMLVICRRSTWRSSHAVSIQFRVLVRTVVPRTLCSAVPQ